MYNNYRLKDRYRMWKTNKNVSFSHCLWLFLSSSEFQANKEREQKSFRISNSISGHNWLAHPQYRITAGKEILSVGFMELGFLSYFLLGFPGGSVVKNLRTMQKLQETWVQSLGGEDPLEEGMATHSSIVAWRFPWREERGGLESIGLQRVGNDWACTHTQLSKLVFLWRFLKRWLRS